MNLTPNCMETANLGYRSLGFWGKPPTLNPILKGIASKANNKAKVMQARETKAIKDGLVKSLDGIHVCMRRQRIGKYGSAKQPIAQSPVSVIRNTRQRAVQTVIEKPVLKAIATQDMPKRQVLRKQKEYVFRFGEEAIMTSI